MLAIGAGLGLLARPFAPEILARLFGPEFATAASFLDSILLLLPIWFASIAINATLVSRRLADLRLGTQVVGVAILVMTPLIMGPSLGTSGIIWGMVGSQCFLLVSGVTLLFFDQPKK
jgi:O-antigen/teichoic acid export membrane protein